MPRRDIDGLAQVALDIVMGCQASGYTFVNRLDIIYKINRKGEYHAKDFG